MLRVFTYFGIQIVSSFCSCCNYFKFIYSYVCYLNKYTCQKLIFGNAFEVIDAIIETVSVDFRANERDFDLGESLSVEHLERETVPMQGY